MHIKGMVSSTSKKHHFKETIYIVVDDQGMVFEVSGFIKDSKNHQIDRCAMLICIVIYVFVILHFDYVIL